MTRLKKLWERKWLRYAMGGATGGIAGFAYYQFAGCLGGG
jgi:hypothetical protein